MTEEEERYNQIRGEDAGIWFISNDFGLKIGIKVPSATIRSLIDGCLIELIFGKDVRIDGTFLHSGVKIYDSITNPMIVTQSYRFFRDYIGLKEVLSKEKVAIEFYDESSICSATAEIEFLQKTVEVQNLVKDINKFYTGENKPSLSSSLDSFCYSIDPSQKKTDTYKIKYHVVSCRIFNWNTLNITLVGYGDVQEMNISDRNEGGGFEKQIWYSIESLFILDVFLNPMVQQEKKLRELTDIFAHYEHGYFLIETKALGVLTLDKKQTIERKVSNVKKQIRKGISQLVGANNNIKRNLEILATLGK